MSCEHIVDLNNAKHDNPTGPCSCGAWHDMRDYVPRAELDASQAEAAAMREQIDKIIKSEPDLVENGAIGYVHRGAEGEDQGVEWCDPLALIGDIMSRCKTIVEQSTDAVRDLLSELERLRASNRALCDAIRARHALPDSHTEEQRMAVYRAEVEAMTGANNLPKGQP